MTLTIDTTRVAHIPGFLAAVATLPLTVRRVEREADIVCIDGTRDWAAEAVRLGRRGVLVVTPGPAAELDGVIASELPVVLDYAGASNPGLLDAVPLAREHPWQFIDVIAQTPADPLGAALDVLALLDRVGVEVLQLDGALDGFGTFEGSIRDGVIAGSLVRGGDASIRVRLSHATRVLEISLPDPHTAEPSVVRLIDAAGSLTLPSQYESSHRSAIATLADSVARDIRPDDVARHARHLAHLAGGS